ncbi:hypothetical protein [Nitrospira moscoviensis]|uniref:Uncharacterized protein n=1 Tax=Nitrospira moscoviensis TaxID=42253 RepID=A0A0K2GDE0_NITMO|nr:hypothetical protein [Nitrospira moscoviensis]ALA58632.1 hypothetical protein NITMOv2_2216 [Nitrospira moscoviensis]
MNNIRKEVRDLISVNEKIQSALSMGERLTDDEAVLIRMCAGELLERVPVSDSDPWYRREGDGKADQARGRIPTDR